MAIINMLKDLMTGIARAYHLSGKGLEPLFFIALCLFVCFWDRISLSPWLEYTGTIMAQCSLNLLGSGVCHHAWLLFVFFGRDKISPCCPGCKLSAWAQAICPPQLLEVLGLEVWATAHSLCFIFYFLRGIILSRGFFLMATIRSGMGDWRLLDSRLTSTPLP